MRQRWHLPRGYVKGRRIYPCIRNGHFISFGKQRGQANPMLCVRCLCATDTEIDVGFNGKASDGNLNNSHTCVASLLFARMVRMLQPQAPDSHQMKRNVFFFHSHCLLHTGSRYIEIYYYWSDPHI